MSFRRQILWLSPTARHNHYDRQHSSEYLNEMQSGYMVWLRRSPYDFTVRLKGSRSQ
jgi:hypothetical protein